MVRCQSSQPVTCHVNRVQLWIFGANPGKIEANSNGSIPVLDPFAVGPSHCLLQSRFEGQAVLGSIVVERPEVLVEDFNRCLTIFR